MIDRLMKKMMPEPNTGCWLYCGVTNRDGYGRIKVKGKIISVHRLSYVLFNGIPILDKNVLHKCDTPSCFNPNHLFLGTPKDNAKDRELKGRGKRSGISRHGTISMYKNHRCRCSECKVIWNKASKIWKRACNLSSLLTK